MIGFSLNYGAFISSQGFPRPRRIGVQKASTFTGFCEKHDSVLFADIESRPIKASARQACLLAYRALCRELFAKEGGVLLRSHFQELDRGLPISHQVALQTMLADQQTGLAAGIRDIRNRKLFYDQILIGSDYSAVRYCVIWFEQKPDIMCSSGKNPTLDFAGRSLQDLGDLSKPAEGLTVSLLASDDRGCAYLSWLAGEEKSCFAFVRSLLELGPDQNPHALVRLVWGFENLFWRPSWWASLQEPQQAALLRRLYISVHPMIPVPSNHLVDDGLRVVNWKVVGADSNDDRLSAIVDGWT